MVLVYGVFFILGLCWVCISWFGGLFILLVLGLWIVVVILLVVCCFLILVGYIVCCIVWLVGLWSWGCVFNGLVCWLGILFVGWCRLLLRLGRFFRMWCVWIGWLVVGRRLLVLGWLLGIVVGGCVVIWLVWIGWSWWRLVVWIVCCIWMYGWFGCRYWLDWLVILLLFVSWLNFYCVVVVVCWRLVRILFSVCWIFVY